MAGDRIKINKWSEKFENSDTRKRQRLGWFLAPSGCDSRGYRLLMRNGRDGIIALGVFQALCQLMATLPKDVRKDGFLANSDGTGMEVADLWEITRMEVADLNKSLDLLKSVGWLLIDDKEVNGSSASDVPPSCRQSASDVPENSGFVKGEGEGEGEDPPISPKGEWDEVFPKNSLSKSKTDQKRIKVLRNNEKMEFIGKWFSRSPETLWTVAEASALRDLNPPRDEVETLKTFREAPYEFHRQDLLTLLNNWNTELDKARNWRPYNNLSTQKFSL